MHDILTKVKKATLSMQRYSWEQGVVAQAFLESGDEDIAIAMGIDGANRQTDDGRCANIGNQSAVTDNCAIGEALILACEKTGDPFLIQAKNRLLHWALSMAPRTKDGIVHHVEYAPEIWVDSFYMLPPFLARAGCFDEALKQINGFWNALFQSDKGLLSHQFNADTGTFPRRDVWGVGNGWAMAGLARVIDLLPDTYENEKAALIEKVITLLDSAIPHQRPDGMFHDVLDDPESFPEVNFGQMMAYSIYRGVRMGWLNETYLPYADLARKAAHTQVDTYGLVRNVCGMPHFNRPFVAPEGQAFFILMENAWNKLHS